MNKNEYMTSYVQKLHLKQNAKTVGKLSMPGSNISSAAVKLISAANEVRCLVSSALRMVSGTEDNSYVRLQSD